MRKQLPIILVAVTLAMLVGAYFFVTDDGSNREDGTVVQSGDTIDLEADQYSLWWETLDDLDGQPSADTITVTVVDDTGAAIPVRPLRIASRGGADDEHTVWGIATFVLDEPTSVTIGFEAQPDVEPGEMLVFHGRKPSRG